MKAKISCVWLAENPTESTEALMKQAIMYKAIPSPSPSPSPSPQPQSSPEFDANFSAMPIISNNANNVINHNLISFSPINNPAMTDSSNLPSVLMIGTGEYTTGYVHSTASNSDKSAGVIALTIFHLRQRNKIGMNIGLCGRDGTKFPAIRKHLHEMIELKYNISTEFNSYPGDNIANDKTAYKSAIANHYKAGDICIITTPDNTHHEIAQFAASSGLHVLIAKPMVKRLKHHQNLIQIANSNNVLIVGEFHKRYDPLYNDAAARIRSGELGNLVHFTSYMSQPKSQLYTFANWLVGSNKSPASDISYYLNAHHVDFLCNSLTDLAKPVKVAAMASYGVANQYLSQLKQSQISGIEDSITLSVTFQPLQNSGSIGTAVFTASWVAPKSDVHSQQRFFFMGEGGEITIDQAHRGYSMASDKGGYKSVNPLFMRYQPDSSGNFAGQNGYGYKSLEMFVQAAQEIRAAALLNYSINIPSAYQRTLPIIQSAATQQTTAILEAGRLSLDNEGSAVHIHYFDTQSQLPTNVTLTNS
jgi:D-galacturonate reductase